MKQILIALVLAFSTCTLANAQNQTTVTHDSIGTLKVTVAHHNKDAKADAKNAAVTVIGVDTADTDSVDQVSSNYSSSVFTIDTDADNFPFNHLGKTLGGGIILGIVSIVTIFGLPVFILAIIFFFRYKNRKARYHLVEQALAAGQPLPADFIKESRTPDQRSQGIKNTFTGIGLFIFLWAITGELGIGCIGLLVMFMGIGQWIVGYKQLQEKAQYTQHSTFTNGPTTSAKESAPTAPQTPTEEQNEDPK